jgi:hypothetical protein
MPVNVYASYALTPTATEDGILGIKVVADSPVGRPIHIALVLDKSGSMDGARIASVKNTLNVLVDKLQVGDKITVIGFSSSADMIASCVTISDDSVRSQIKASVDKLVADGGTNMESGITLLGQLFSTGTELPLPDTVVLLTDGYVNEGITTVAGVHSLLKSYVPNLPVYALGYGDDHNSDFMRELSRRTSGTYTFIDSEIALPASIGELLGSLQNEVAKGGFLTFPESWTCLELGSTGTSHGLGSLVADKPTWTLLKVPASSVTGNVVLSYKNVGSTDDSLLPVVIDGALDRLDVMEQHLRCITASALDKAAGFIKAYQMDSAKQTVQDAIKLITTSEAATKPMAIRFKAQLDEMIEEISTTHRGHRGFANLLQRTTGTATRYTQQRGVSSQGGGDDDDGMFSTPLLMRAQAAMVTGYSQSAGGGEDPRDQMT